MVVVKLAISAGLLGWLLAYVDRGALYAQLAGASSGWLLAGFLVKSLAVPSEPLRWRSVAALGGIRFSRLDALRLTMSSIFLGQALPGAVGGDIVRGWLTVRLGFPITSTVLALVVDRVAAMLGMVVLVLAGLPHLLNQAPAGTAPVIGIAVMAIIAGSVALFFADRLPIPRRLHHPRLLTLQGLITQMRQALRANYGVAALGWSLLVHACTVIAAGLFARALGVSLSPLDCLAVIPFGMIASALPVSLAGWGVREGAMVAGFAILGLPADGAIAISLLIGASVLLISLPGALFWLTWAPASDTASSRV